MGTISENISRLHEKIQNDPDLAREVGNEACDAILKGRDSDEWAKYMKRFADNDKQHDRLIGKDKDFMKGEYANLLLAYVAAAGPCMSGTELRLAVNMKPAMKEVLDKGV